MGDVRDELGLDLHRLLRLPDLLDLPAQILLFQNIIRHTYVFIRVITALDQSRLYRKASKLFTVRHKIMCLFPKCALRFKSIFQCLKCIWKHIADVFPAQFIAIFQLALRRCIGVGNLSVLPKDHHHFQCLFHKKYAALTLADPFLHTHTPPLRQKKSAAKNCHAFSTANDLS